MAIANSYSRDSGGTVTLLVDRVRSYKASHGANVTIIAKPWESYARGHAFGDVDSLNTFAIRVQNCMQRGAIPAMQRWCDVSGFIYGSGIYAVMAFTFKKLEVSYVSSSGPWFEVSPNTSDPAHLFPSQGSPTGIPFNLVVDPNVWGLVDIYFRLTVTTALIGDQSEVGGPFLWFGDSIYPSQPSGITVPFSSASGNFTVSWLAGDGAITYELEEGIEQPDTTIQWLGMIYSGGDLSYNRVGAASETTYWYRVRSVNPVPNYSDWVVSSNGCTVERPAFKITPDLGWANVDDMFNPALNGAMAHFYLDELATTALTPSTVMGRYNMVLSYSGVNYIIPGDQIGKFGSSGRCLWRYVSDPVQAFTLAKEARSPGGVPYIPARVRPRILR